MRKLLLFVLFICLFAMNPLHAEENPVVLDNGVTLELDPEDKNEEQTTIYNQFENFMEIGTYFEKNYPGNYINEDFSDDLAQFFPKLKGQELYDRQNTVRDLIKIYRYGKSVVESIKEKILVPEAPPLILSDDEYEKPYTDPYIESEKLVVIQDFKKIVSYSSDPKDFRSMRAKALRDAEKRKPKNDFDKISQMFSKLEWKKLPFYGVIYDDPFAGNLGVGEWVNNKSDEVAVRLITDKTAINNSKEIRGALHLAVPIGQSVLSIKKDGFDKLKMNFANSNNLEKFDAFSPVPVRNINQYGEEVVGYTTNVAIPIIFTVKDPSQPLTLQAEVDMSVCGVSECHVQKSNPKLFLDEGDAVSSTIQSFINNSFYNLPSDVNKDIKFKKAVVDDRNILRVLFETSKSPTTFEVFAEATDGTELSPPRTSINGDNIIVMFEAKDKNAQLEGKEFVVIASMDNKYMIKNTFVAEETSLFDIMRNKLSIGLLLLSIAGGFILNFMPCVFPVLSVKLMSLTKFGAAKQIKKDFLITTLGIFCAFFMTSIFLSILKISGQSVGWGMQFQNAPFLVFMIFAICFFMAQIMGIIDISFSYKQQNKEGVLPFLTGIFVVLMATPCTAPYLGTAIGFALTGSVVDIFVIMMGVAFGLSIPYLLIALTPGFSTYLPSPGGWMSKLNTVMIIALIATIIWLFTILTAQTTFGTTMRLCSYVIIFMFILWFRKLIIEQTEISDMENDIKLRVIKFVKKAAIVVLSIIFITAAIDVTYHFNKIQAQRIAQRQKQIDYELIGKYLKEDKAVIIKIEADWCLTCSYNNFIVFANPGIKKLVEQKKLVLMTVDWTSYNAEVLEFMEGYGRKGLPFYILFSPTVPEGLVLPEVLNDKDLSRILHNV